MTETTERLGRIAVYPSVLYGADFIVESIASVLPYVERVYVVFMQRPWGDTSGVEFGGKWISWPERFDDARERVAALKNDRVVSIEAQKSSPWDRWSFAVNDVLGKVCDPSEVVLIDPDCVFSDVKAKQMFAEWEAHPEYVWAAPGQIELWKTPEWKIERPRSMVSLHRGDVSLLSSDARKRRGVNPPETHKLSGHVHNFGFCVSDSTMRWKHLTALAFSPVIGESLPNPAWLDKCWRAWHPTDNNRSLEPSLGCESAIQKAVPHDISDLPVSIKKRFDSGEWVRW